MKNNNVLRGMGTTSNAVDSVQGTPTEKKERAKTASFTAEQVRKIAKTEGLGELIAQQIEASEGGVKGTIMFQVADMMQKQMKLKV